MSWYILLLLSLTDTYSDSCPKECLSCDTRKIHCKEVRGRLTGLPVNTQYLYLFDSKMTHINKHTFAGLRELRFIYIERASLIAIEMDSFHHLTKLDSLRLSKTNLTVIPKGLFDACRNLQVLIIEDSHINSIEDEAFIKLNQLKKLWLRGNTLKTLPANLFMGLTHLLYLDLSDNHLQSTKDTVQAFINLTSLVNLNLRNNQLESLPEMVLSNMKSLRWLYLDENMLSAITVHGLHHLKVISVTGNRISAISCENFIDLPSLKTLHLDQNMISSIDEYAFQGLIKLEMLTLSENLLGLSIAKNLASVLGRLASLKYLNLADNNLMNASFIAYANMTSLVVLNLDRTYLKSLSVVGMPSLRKLTLRYNRIQKLCNDSFRDMPNLYELQLTNNLISSISRSAFTDLKRLKSLYLSSNMLASLHQNLFRNLVSLELLHLKNNNISIIVKSTLFGLRSLKVLSLRGNNIHSIAKGAFMNLPKLHGLDLEDNNLTAQSIEAFMSFQHLGMLSRLKLSRNPLGRISNVTFCPMLMNLTGLSLQQTKVVSIHPKSFICLKHLTMLNMSKSALTYVTNETFTTPALRILDITDNPISYLSKDVFPPSLNSLHATGTNIHCTCTLRKSLEAMPLAFLKADCINNQMQRILLTALKCNSSFASEQDIDSVSSNELWLTVIYVILGVILVSVCTVVIIIKCKNRRIGQHNADDNAEL